MFKLIKRFFGLDYNDNKPAAEKHSGIGYSGSPALDKVMDFEGFKNVAPANDSRPAVEDKGTIKVPGVEGTRPAVEDKGTLKPVKKAPKKPAAKKAAPKKK